jgi:NADH-quinone oxidoreductase subunit N
MINYTAILPELTLVIGALVLLMVGAYGKNAERFVSIASIAVLALTLVLNVNSIDTVTFNGAFVVDSFGRFAKTLILIGSLAALILSRDFFKREGISAFEIPVLILLSTTGMMALVSARDLIALYLGLELMSLALYVLAAIHRDNVKATEAGLKYFVLGALSSGMLLYGASLLYGFSGAVTFAGIAAAAKTGVNLGMIFGLVFVLAGIAFKISAVPFHMWTPDVYEGAPTPITAFFAGAPKMAAMALFLRITSEAFPSAKHEWQQIVMFIALGSMILGAFAAIGQTNIKRLMAYSSIANMGFALVGLAAGTVDGVSGVLIYMAIYLVTTIGMFAAILTMRDENGALEDINDLAGLSKTAPLTALSILIFMFSMIGIPPLAGFFAKFYVFTAAVSQGLWVLAVLGVIASVVGCYYYLRIVKIMYLDEAKVTFIKPAFEYKAIMYLSALLVTLYVLMPKPLIDASLKAAKAIF